MRIVIHGFGRIGRMILRQILITPEHSDIEVVAVNDLAQPETCAYLFKYDSVFGPLPGGAVAENGRLHAGQRSIPLLTGVKMSDLPLTDVDLVLDCTGATKHRATAEDALTAGRDRAVDLRTVGHRRCHRREGGERRPDRRGAYCLERILYHQRAGPAAA